VGVDPGKLGALALLNPHGKLVEVVDMPASGEKAEVDQVLVADVLRSWGRHVASCNDGIHVAVEQVAAFPKNGSMGNFKLGCAYGIVLGAIGMAQYPTTLYRPAVWKKRLGLSSDKEASRARALRQWPERAEDFKLKKHADRAEAALIAWFHWKLDRGEVPS
jgi:Holliday junction resolvasome RuvABC endonuclease subunit